MFDLHQLQVFVTAAENLNFSETARKLHMSQPSVTQNIHQLENYLGKPLFTRVGKRLVLTEAGLNLLPMARQMIIVSLRTEELMGVDDHELVGELQIGCSTSPGKYVLPLILAEFMKRHPKVRAACQVVPRDFALQLLNSGKVQFAFTSSDAIFDKNLDFHLFMRDPILLVVSCNHPWAKLGEVTLPDLFNESIVMREESSGTYQQIRNMLISAGKNINDLQLMLTLGNSESIAVAVSQGIGVGFISSKVYEHVDKNRLVSVKIRDFNPRQDIYICRHRLHPFKRVQNEFWDFVTQRVDEFNLSPACVELEKNVA